MKRLVLLLSVLLFSFSAIVPMTLVRRLKISPVCLVPMASRLRVVVPCVKKFTAQSTVKPLRAQVAVRAIATKALDADAKKKSEDMWEEMDNSWSSFMDAFHYCSLERVKKILDKRPQYLDAIKKDDRYLIQAIKYRAVDPEVIDFLLKSGCNANAKDPEGNNLLHHAKDAHRAKVLLAHGVDPLEKNQIGKTYYEKIREHLLSGAFGWLKKEYYLDDEYEEMCRQKCYEYEDIYQLLRQHLKDKGIIKTSIGRFTGEIEIGDWMVDKGIASWELTQADRDQHLLEWKQARAHNLKVLKEIEAEALEDASSKTNNRGTIEGH